MRFLNVMLKPASSLCNMRCKYCFYADVSDNRQVKSFGIMQPETVDAILDHLFAPLSPGDSINIAFQGGEPTVAGIEWFRGFLAKAEAKKGGIKVTYALQTNAILLNEEWCRLLKEHRFLVGVSLDGPEENHDHWRVDAAGQGTWRRVMEAIRLLNEYKVDYNVLMTLTNSLARHPNQVWKLIREQNFRYVQFTPCLAELDANGRTDYELTSDRFASFYTQIFRLWKQEFQKDNYYSIKLIDDLVNLLAFGEVNACGLTGSCNPQVVVEADGSVYPCDFYMTDQWKTGNLAEQPLSEIMASPVNRTFMCRPRERARCAECRYLRICNGACRRMQKQICYQEGDSACGYRKLLDACLEEMLPIARRQKLLRR